MHDDVEALVHAVEIALVAPELEALARDALDERRKRGEDVDLRLVSDVRQAIGDEGGDLLLDAHLEGVPGRPASPPPYLRLGRRIEVRTTRRNTATRNFLAIAT
jgi:hypothetical protein